MALIVAFELVPGLPVEGKELIHWTELKLTIITSSIRSVAFLVIASTFVGSVHLV